MLKTNSTTAKNAMFTGFPPEQRLNKFVELTGMFLASRNLSKQLVGEEPDILVFELDEVEETDQMCKMREHARPEIYRKNEATINSLVVKPLLDPEAAINNEESPHSTRNTYKATFGEVPKVQCMIVVILPFCVPDNICHFAAQEAAMTVD